MDWQCCSFSKYMWSLSTYRLSGEVNVDKSAENVLKYYPFAAKSI